MQFVEKMALTAYFICSQLTAQFTDLKTICELICTFEDDGHTTAKSVQYDFVLNKFPYEKMNRGHCSFQNLRTKLPCVLACG